MNGVDWEKTYCPFTLMCSDEDKYVHTYCIRNASSPGLKPPASLLTVFAGRPGKNVKIGS